MVFNLPTMSSISSKRDHEVADLQEQIEVQIQVIRELDEANVRKDATIAAQRRKIESKQGTATRRLTYQDVLEERAKVNACKDTDLAAEGLKRREDAVAAVAAAQEKGESVDLMTAFWASAKPRPVGYQAPEQPRDAFPLEYSFSSTEDDRLEESALPKFTFYSNEK